MFLTSIDPGPPHTVTLEESDSTYIGHVNLKDGVEYADLIEKLNAYDEFLQELAAYNELGGVDKASNDAPKAVTRPTVEVFRAAHDAFPILG